MNLNKQVATVDVAKTKLIQARQGELTTHAEKIENFKAVASGKANAAREGAANAQPSATGGANDDSATGLPNVGDEVVKKVKASVPSTEEAAVKNAELAAKNAESVVKQANELSSTPASSSTGVES